MNVESGAAVERPLSGYSRLALFSGAGASILLFYVFFCISFLLLALLVGCELLFVVLSRAVMLMRLMQPHVNLLEVFARSFWPRKRVEIRIQLQQPEAPALFEMVQRLCQSAAVAMAGEISVDLSTNAWVRLKGYRRGAGKTTLGIGYDLLAGLSRWEMEAVLAHEITHAKLVRRGYTNWLGRGLRRMVQLSRSLQAYIAGYRNAKKVPPPPAPYLFGVADRLTRLAARSIAACSRQDEFDADRGAAALCGAQAFRSSLLKLGPLGERSARLPWNERVARLQSGEGLSNWLVGEFASAEPRISDEAKSNLFFQYSTHPSLADRLAALPDDAEGGRQDSLPAIHLLNDPESVAEALISHVQKVTAEAERKDSTRLRRLAKPNSGKARPLHYLGILLVGTSIVGLSMWPSHGMSLALACLVMGSILLAIVCFRLARYRDRVTLAVPDFGALKSAAQNKRKITQIELNAMKTELQSSVANIPSKRKRELKLAIASYDSLSQCDYFRAHVAAGLCLEINRKSIEGAAGLAVAAAALGRIQEVRQALNYLRRTTGMRTPSVTWAAGWAALECGDWATAEAFLERRCLDKPQNPTLLLLLASCQRNRGKLQSALLSARQACSPEPANNAHRKFLIDLLLDVGYLREAQQALNRLKDHANDDSEMMSQWVRLNLLSGNFASADEWSERLKSKQPGGPWFVTLGRCYEAARQDLKAAAFYDEALAMGFYPEALMGLARLEARHQKKEEARNYLVSALNTERELGERALGPLPLLRQILAQLVSLEEPVAGCRAWIATLKDGRSPAGLANKSLLIYAPSHQYARDSLHRLLSAMQPAVPPIMSDISWAEAPKEQQPDQPVRAGIQGVMV
jgi:Zn-dependent protease with chaperone function/tetratricopeptide (TPR) repeat protein